MANKNYALKSRVQLSGQAAHTAKLLIRASAQEKAEKAGPSGIGRMKLDVSPGRGWTKVRKWVMIRGDDNKGGGEKGGVEEGGECVVSGRDDWTAEKWEGEGAIDGGDQGKEADDNGGVGVSKWWREDYWVYGEEGVMIGRRNGRGRRRERGGEILLSQLWGR